MLTKEKLESIAQDTNAFRIGPIPKSIYEAQTQIWSMFDMSDKMLSHIQELEAENASLKANIEHQRRALEWLRKREVSIYELAAPCQCEDDFLDANGNCPHGENPENICPKYHFRGTGECWIDYALNATNEATND